MGARVEHEPVCTRANPWEADCPSREILSLVADKWALLLLALLQDAPRRHAELMRGAPGISQKMLTQTLRSLERHGLISRHDHGEVPPRVEYTSTALGASLSGALGALDAWVEDHYSTVEAARQRYTRPRPPSEQRIP